MYEHSEVRQLFPVFKEKILELIDTRLYSYERYGLEFAALMIYSPEPVNLEICQASIRQSDSAHVLDENLVLVIFDMVGENSSLKAAQNFLHAYQRFDVKQELYLLVAPVHQDGTAIDIGSRLFILLEYALKERLVNTTIDINMMQSRSWM